MGEEELLISQTNIGIAGTHGVLLGRDIEEFSPCNILVASDEKEKVGDNDNEQDLAMFFITNSNTNEPGIFELELRNSSKKEKR